MPSENCCVAHDEMRVISFISTYANPQVAYEVPAGKVFVLTAWTFVNELGHQVSARLRRGTELVAYNRMWDSVRRFSHITFPSGIAFGPGAKVMVEALIGMGEHLFFGYEHDLP